MKTKMKHIYLGSLLALSSPVMSNCAHDPVTQANAANSSSSRIASDSRKALDHLYAQNPTARKLGRSASGILVFPEILKGGLMVGAEAGNGALFNSGGGVSAYYQTAGASYGLQAGVQKYGYALFLMSPQEVRKLNDADGWEVGSSPSLVVVDKGMAASLSTKTLDKGTYAFIFDQKGLMGGIGLKGSKITRIHPKQ
ncbi:MAG: YSC84-related protein [Verrucomicrobiota bacterium]